MREAASGHADPTATGWVRLGLRRVYVLPTGQGLLYGLACLLMTLGSLNYMSNLGLLFSFLCLAAGLLAIPHTWRNLAYLQLRVEPAAPPFAGDQAEFPVRLTEDRGLGRAGLRLRARDGAEVSTDLAAREECRVLVKIPAPRRGALRLGRLRISSRFPLGLWRAWSELDCPVQTLVYPRPTEAPQAPPLALFVRAESGDRGVGADDFLGLRGYRPGDPPRRLDWKALARERGLVTRQFGGDRAEQVWLTWEAVSGDPETRLSRLCRQVLDATRAGQTYGLRLPDREIPPGTGEAHQHRCLAALARYPAGHV